jgi:NADH dehydrogenase
VAGGTGFVGSAIARELSRRGRRVSVLTRKLRGGVSGADDRIDYRVGDVTDRDSLRSALEGVAQVVQCVQFAGFPVEDARRGRTFLDVDAGGTTLLAGIAAEVGVEKLIYLSGVGADRASARGWFRAKGIAEDAVAGAGGSYSILRPSWIYGPGDVSLNRFVHLIRTVPGFFPQLGSGDQRLNPVFISDVARLVADIAETSVADGQTLEIGGPSVLTIDEIIGAAMRVIGRKKPILHVPLWLARVGGSILEELPGQLLSRDAIDFVTQSAVADNGELYRRFPGFRLQSLETALASYLPGSS